MQVRFMSFEKIGKGEALVWLSGAAGVKALQFLSALILGFTFVIPEINFNPSRLFYPTVFIIGLLASYLLYRIGVAGEKPSKVVSLWLSGVFGSTAIGQIVLAVMGWSIVIPQYAFTFSSASEPFSFAAVFIVAAILSIALWKSAKKSGAARKKKR